MKINVGKEEVYLDPKNLQFDETNLNEKLCNEASLYNYFAEILAKAAMIHSLYEDEYEAAVAKKFTEIKEQSSASDKLCENKSKSCDEVLELLKKVRKAKFNKDAVQSYLRSMDKNHENMINTAISIRNELKKLSPNIKLPSYNMTEDDYLREVMKS